MPKVQVLGDRLLLKVASDKDKTDSGLLIPLAAQKNSTELRPAVVVNVGADVAKKIKKGAKVLVAVHSGMDVEFGKEMTPTGKHKLLRYSDIMAVIE